ncbi:hypothetical protein F2Q69_00043193 [Brassica cretica]|uniref:Uncharacterized protein n=1 Tax=Brassica cretica TaxID=69181 RepID=A0A8S9NJU7_BRACR|nr:hypothetical protein F2Q69_00043193 [Brassica cretica]
MITQTNYGDMISDGSNEKWWIEGSRNSCRRLLIFPTPVVARYDALDQQGRNEWIEVSHRRCGRLLIFPTQCPRIWHT